MIFDILIQLAVMQQDADLTRLLVELRQVICLLNASLFTCQVMPVG